MIETTTAAPTTREQWLVAVTDAVRPMFEGLGYTVPKNVRVTCGWPSIGGTRKCPRIGEAWSSVCSEDATFEIFISPRLGDVIEAAATLVHELVHVTVGLECGHKGAFAKCARAVGLEGKLTATHAGKDLAERLMAICAAVGPYPHATLMNGGARKDKVQGTRMVKIACACGYSCRTTRKWIEVGMPTCPCGEEMVEAA